MKYVIAFMFALFCFGCEKVVDVPGPIIDNGFDLIASYAYHSQQHGNLVNIASDGYIVKCRDLKETVIPELTVSILGVNTRFYGHIGYGGIERWDSLDVSFDSIATGRYRHKTFTGWLTAAPGTAYLTLRFINESGVEYKTSWTY
jgi:hypothetical protein